MPDKEVKVASYSQNVLKSNLST